MAYKELISLSIFLIINFRGSIAPNAGAGRSEQNYAAEFSKVMKETVLNEFIKLNDLEKKYKDLTLTTIERNISDIVLRKAATLSGILRDKENIVKRIAEEAQRLHGVLSPEDLSVLAKKVSFHHPNPPVNGTQPEWDPSITPYHNSRCNCEEELGGGIVPSQCLQYQTDYITNTHFGAERVSFMNTSVHLPIDVYEGGELVLKDILLSDGIGGVMKQEVCASSEFSHLTKWVYFTTETGVMRFYPDRVWTRNCDDVNNVYDSRTAPWYINSMSSPKDVILLIDSSGSVKGPTYTALRWAVVEFLKTLTPNDFMNVIFFNNKVTTVNSCKGLFPATPRNKQIVLRLLDAAEFRYETIYEPAFQEAFSSLHTAFSHEGRYSARCNPSAVLFTDGDSTYPYEAVEQWNAEKEFRAFSFAVGETFYSKGDTKKIACENRGYFDLIPFFEARQRVWKYLKKLSQPLYENRHQEPSWTLPYQDRFGIGEVLSVSMPVYFGNQSSNRTAENASRVTAVVGTDLSLEELKKIIYDIDMNKDYHSFVIDNNGFAVIHPGLNEARGDDVLAVDLLELEGEKLMKVREQMIKASGAIGEMTISKNVFSDNKYLDYLDYTYVYASVNNVFRIGVGIPSSKSRYMDTVWLARNNYSSVTLSLLTNANDRGSVSEAYLYSSPCETRTSTSHNPCTVNTTSSVPCQDNCFADGVPLSDFDDSECDKTSVPYNNLLCHGFLSDDFSMNKWEAAGTVKNGALALFFAVDSPSFVRILYRNFTKQTGTSLSRSDELIKKDIKDILRDPRNSTYFRRATHKPQWMMFSAHTTEAIEESKDVNSSTAYANLNVGGAYIVATKVVRVLQSDNNLHPAVSGAVLSPEAFTRNMVSLDWKCNDTNNCNKDDWGLLCGDAESVECLILDDGGYLISSNQERHNKSLGQFIGKLEGKLLEEMLDIKLYETFYSYDYQAYCERTVQDKSSAMRMSRAPSISDILSVGWWLTSSARIFLHSLFQNSFVALWSVLTVGHSRILQSEAAATHHETEMCVIKQPVLAFGPNGQNGNGILGEYKCSESCDREFNAIWITETNLMMIIMQLDKDTACYDACRSSAQYPLSSTDVTLDLMCANGTARYRETPGTCYDSRNLDEALDSPCSRSFSLRPSYYAVLALLAVDNFCHRILL